MFLRITLAWFTKFHNTWLDNSGFSRSQKTAAKYIAVGVFIAQLTFVTSKKSFLKGLYLETFYKVCLFNNHAECFWDVLEETHVLSYSYTYKNHLN